MPNLIRNFRVGVKVNEESYESDKVVIKNPPVNAYKLKTAKPLNCNFVPVKNCNFAASSSKCKKRRKVIEKYIASRTSRKPRFKHKERLATQKGSSLDRRNGKIAGCGKDEGASKLPGFIPRDGLVKRFTVDKRKISTNASMVPTKSHIMSKMVFKKKHADPRNGVYGDGFILPHPVLEESMETMPRDHEYIDGFADLYLTSISNNHCQSAIVKEEEDMADVEQYVAAFEEDFEDIERTVSEYSEEEVGQKFVDIKEDFNINEVVNQVEEGNPENEKDVQDDQKSDTVGNFPQIEQSVGPVDEVAQEDVIDFSEVVEQLEEIVIDAAVEMLPSTSKTDANVNSAIDLALASDSDGYVSDYNMISKKNPQHSKTKDPVTLYSGYGEPMFRSPNSLNPDSMDILANVMQYVHHKPCSKFANKLEIQLVCPRVSLEVLTETKMMLTCPGSIYKPSVANQPRRAIWSRSSKAVQWAGVTSSHAQTMTEPETLHHRDLLTNQYPTRTYDDTRKIENDSRDIVCNAYEYFHKMSTAKNYKAAESATKYKDTSFSTFRKLARYYNRPKNEQLSSVNLRSLGSIELHSVRRFEGFQFDKDPNKIDRRKRDEKAIDCLDVNQRKQLLDIKNEMKKELGFPPPVYSLAHHKADNPILADVEKIYTDGEAKHIIKIHLKANGAQRKQVIRVPYDELNAHPFTMLYTPHFNNDKNKKKPQPANVFGKPGVIRSRIHNIADGQLALFDPELIEEKLGLAKNSKPYEYRDASIPSHASGQIKETLERYNKEAKIRFQAKQDYHTQPDDNSPSTSTGGFTECTKGSKGSKGSKGNREERIDIDTDDTDVVDEGNGTANKRIVVQSKK